MTGSLFTLSRFPTACSPSPSSIPCHLTTAPCPPKAALRVVLSDPPPRGPQRPSAANSAAESPSVSGPTSLHHLKLPVLLSAQRFMPRSWISGSLSDRSFTASSQSSPSRSMSSLVCSISTHSLSPGLLSTAAPISTPAALRAHVLRSAPGSSTQLPPLRLHWTPRKPQSPRPHPFSFPRAHSPFLSSSASSSRDPLQQESPAPPLSSNRNPGIISPPLCPRGQNVLSLALY